MRRTPIVLGIAIAIGALVACWDDTPIVCEQYPAYFHCDGNEIYECAEGGAERDPILTCKAPSQCVEDRFGGRCLDLRVTCDAGPVDGCENNVRFFGCSSTTPGLPSTTDACGTQTCVVIDGGPCCVGDGGSICDPPWRPH